MTQASSIICGVDGSARARAAARVAAALADRLGVRLIAVHVLAPDPPQPARQNGFELLAQAGARGVINEALSAARAAHAKARLERGPAALALALVAAEEDAAAVVLGAHGDRDARSAALGSVVAAAVALCPCPVVVVPALAARHAARPRFNGEVVVACGADVGCLAVAAQFADALGTRPRLVASGLACVGRASLIAVGSSGPGPRRGSGLDPGARHLLRDATVPVLIVPPRATPRTARATIESQA